MKKIFLLIILVASISLAQTGTLTGYANVTALKQRLDSVLVTNARVLVLETGKVNWSDSAGINGWYKRAYVDALVGGKQTSLGYTPVPTTRTLSINGTSYDLSANRNWTIAEGVLDTNIVNDLIEVNEDSTGSWIVGTKESLDSLIRAFWNGTLAGGLSESQVNALIEVNEDTTGSALIGTKATLDSIITAFWNGTLGGGIASIGDADDVDLTGLDDFEILQYRNEYGAFVPVPFSGFDTAFVYQRIDALEDSVTNLRASINNLIDALNNHGVDISDNTPPAKPTSFVAVGGTSQTQYVADWTNPTASDLDSIRFYEGSANDSTQLVWITSLPETDTAYTRTGRTANTTYWSAVKAIDDSGNVSYFSNIDSAKTLASAVVDTGFFKFDAEDGVANLTITGAGVTASTDQKYAGSYSYKVSGLGGAIRTYADIDFTNAGAGNEDTIWVTYRIYIPAGTSISNNDGWNYASLLIGGGDANGDNGEMGLESSVDSIYAWQKPFGTTRTTNWQTGAWHKIEIKYIQGTGTNATDSCWVDGTLIYGTSAGTGAVDTDGFRFGAYNWTMNIGEAIYYDDIIFSRNRIVE